MGIQEMNGHMIPVYCDKEKDSALIEYLKTKTNRSAYIRELIYRDMKGYELPKKPEVKEELQEEQHINPLTIGKLLNL